MKFLTLLLLLLIAALAGFIALNWSAFLASTSLSLGIASIHAPLGLVMLGICGLLTVIFLVFALYLQTFALLETRRHAKEQHSNRKLADQAEASRFTDLRAYLETEMKHQSERMEEHQVVLSERLEKLDHDIRLAIDQSENSLSASIGELEDRIKTTDPTPSSTSKA